MQFGWHCASDYCVKGRAPLECLLPRIFPYVRGSGPPHAVGSTAANRFPSSFWALSPVFSPNLAFYDLVRKKHFSKKMDKNRHHFFEKNEEKKHLLDWAVIFWGSVIQNAGKGLPSSVHKKMARTGTDSWPVAWRLIQKWPKKWTTPHTKIKARYYIYNEMSEKLRKSGAEICTNVRERCS